MSDNDDRKPIFSNAMILFLKARLMEILGLVLLILSVILFVSLLTADRKDPSFTMISDAPVQNLLGSFGAHVSAGLYAVLGLSAFALAIVPLFWGVSYIRKQPVPHMRWRLVLLPICLILIAGSLYAFDGGGVSDNGGAVGAVAVGLSCAGCSLCPVLWGWKQFIMLARCSRFLDCCHCFGYWLFRVQAGPVPPPRWAVLVAS